MTTAHLAFIKTESDTEDFVFGEDNCAAQNKICCLFNAMIILV